MACGSCDSVLSYSMKDFVHLHNHTSYSQLDGAAKIPEFADECVRLGMSGLGITDHGHMNGVIDFYKECRKRDLTPVIGTEGYFADDRLSKEKKRYHITLFAESNEGYRNLIKISSDAFLKGFYGKPRTDWEALAAHSEGVIATTGCLGGPVLQRLLNDDVKGATETAARLQDIFGKDNLFVELMRHGLPEQNKTNPLLLHVAKTIGAPLLVTNDCHYTKAEDALPHDLLLCCQTGALQSDKKRFKFDSDQHYLKSSEEMRLLFSEVEVGCDNTLWIAERAKSLTIDFDTLHLPNFPDIPEGFRDDSEYLEHIVRLKLPERYGETPSSDVTERLEYELSVIKDMNLSSYFLIFWDLAAFAKRERIMTGPGRGSAAGSIVSYILGVTKLDPLKHDLLFERFINPDRIALADIDWDIDTRYRDKLINYTAEKYGRDRVAQIITFTKIKSRTAVRDSARVLGYPWQLGDKIAKLMPPLLMGVETPLNACFEETPGLEAGFKAAQGLRELYESDAEARRVIDAARGIEGLIKSSGVHAAGVVIGDTALDDLVPLQLVGDENKERRLVTQYEKNTIEDLGLLKMDFLGLRNLDVISDTLDRLGLPIDFLENLETMDDPELFRLLQRGDTIGIFQVESAPMRALLRKMKPTSTDDISATLALYRPGPMAENMHNDYADRKNGRQSAVPFHPDAADLLDETYQLSVYQEQVMRLSQRFAGYSLAEADNLRKIMGKKLPEKMKAERGKFVEGCVDTGYSREEGERLFHMIEGFSNYGFNKSHSYAYGYITYWTAYLKTHHPKEYMASLCSSVMTGSNHLQRTAFYLNEARRMGLVVHPPDVNLSEMEYTVTEDGIRIGLTLLRDVGKDLASQIVSNRPYVGLYDFVRRVQPKADSMRSLAASGALEQFGTRMGVASISDNMLSAIRKNQKKVASDQASFFTAEQEERVSIQVPEVEYSWSEKLKKERESIGLFLSGHPLEDFAEKTTPVTVADFIEMGETPKGQKMLLFVSAVDVKWTKKGDAMANLILEDQTGPMSVVCFPRKWEEVKSFMTADTIIYAWVRAVEDGRDEPSYILSGAELVQADESENETPPVAIHLPRGFNSDQEYLSRLKGILLTHRGSSPVEVYLSRSSKVDLKNEYRVRFSPELLDSVKGLFEAYIESRKK